MNMSRFTLALLMAIGCALLGPGTLALPGAIPAAAAQPPTGEESHAEDSHSEDSHSNDEAAHGAAAHGEGEGGSHGNTNPLSVDPDLAFFTLIIFALLLLVLGKFAWGPIRDALDNREQSIAEQIAEAQRSHDEARRLLGEHEAKLSKAQEEIRGLMDDARKEAEVQKQSIMAEAEKAAAAQQARAVREIHAAKNAALEELAQSEINRVVDLAGRIVGKELRADDHAGLIADAIKRLPSDN